MLTEMIFTVSAQHQGNFFHRTQVSLGSDLWVLMSVQDYFADLTDVTLADEDNDSIPTDDVDRTIQGNVAMQVGVWDFLVANL